MLLLLSLSAVVSCSEKASKAEDSEEEHEEEVVRGPHGGRLLSEGELQLEITIYEMGVDPQFRVYAYENNKPVDPSEIQLSIELHRLGGATDTFRFQEESDYLRGDKIVEEPHSFDVKVQAKRKGKDYSWEYSQIEGRVELTPQQVQSAGIVVQTAGPARIKSTLALPGEITLNRDKMAHVIPRLAGVVSAVRKNLGDSVRKGEVIAVIESRELAELKSDYLASTRKRDLARLTYEREESLWKKKISSEQDYLVSKQALEEAEIAVETATQKLIALGLSGSELKNVSASPQTELTKYPVRAPLDGVVIEKDISLGEAVKEDADIFMIADLSTVWVEVAVYSKDTNVVREGQKVKVRAKALSLEQEGTLTYLGSLVGEQTRTAKGLIVLQNPDRKWRPGLLVNVELVQQEDSVPVAVSIEAIQSYRDWSVVFAQFGNFFEVRPVKLGQKDENWVEVLEGLSAGQKYASHNSFVLKADLGKSEASHEH